MILTWIAWLLAFVPLAALYAAIFCFIGYTVDPGRRESGAWWGDLPSTIGIFVGIYFAYVLVSESECMC
jgi:hypothetical protein